MKLLIAGTLAMLVFTGALHAGQTQPVSLDAVLEQIRATNDLPALAAAVVLHGETVGLGAVGLRKIGSPQRVTMDDTWHIGSCTKSMTAVLAAMLVEKGQWRWDTTLADMFPDLAPQMQAEWRGVTLEELLTQHGGVPHELDENGLTGRLWQRAGLPPVEQREYLTRDLLTREKPVAPPGTRYIYANAGYVLVGHAIETALGKPWEEVVRERLFGPLGMDSAGFGPPAAVGEINEPWGHVLDPDGTLKPIPPGLRADNPPVYGPAGTVHCSIGDLAKYAAFQVRGARGQGALLKPETFKNLYVPFGNDDYACGWFVTRRSWGGKVLTHNGTNKMNYTVIWLAPEKDFAVVVCTNLGGDHAEKAIDTAAWALIQQFLVKP